MPDGNCPGARAEQCRRRISQWGLTLSGRCPSPGKLHTPQQGMRSRAHQQGTRAAVPPAGCSPGGMSSPISGLLLPNVQKSLSTSVSFSANCSVTPCSPGQDRRRRGSHQTGSAGTAGWMHHTCASGQGQRSSIQPGPATGKEPEASLHPFVPRLLWTPGLPRKPTAWCRSSPQSLGSLESTQGAIPCPLPPGTQALHTGRKADRARRTWGWGLQSVMCCVCAWLLLWPFLSGVPSCSGAVARPCPDPEALYRHGDGYTDVSHTLPPVGGCPRQPQGMLPTPPPSCGSPALQPAWAVPPRPQSSGEQID